MFLGVYECFGCYWMLEVLVVLESVGDVERYGMVLPECWIVWNVVKRCWELK